MEKGKESNSKYNLFSRRKVTSSLDLRLRKEPWTKCKKSISELRFIKYILHIFYSAQAVWTMTHRKINEMAPLKVTREWCTRGGGAFPGSLEVRTPCCHCRGSGFNPWSGNEDPTSHMAWPKKSRVQKNQGEETAVSLEGRPKTCQTQTLEADNSLGYAGLRAPYLQELLEAYEGAHLPWACDGFNPTRRERRQYLWFTHIFWRGVRDLLIWRKWQNAWFPEISSRLRMLSLY